MSFRIRRSAAAVAMLCTVVATLSACANSPKQGAGGQPEAVTAAQAAVEFKTESATLTLPSGKKWPADSTPPSVAPDGHGQVYQKGWGTTAADHFWYCDWEDRYLQPDLSSSDKDVAYKTLLTVRNTHYYQSDILARDKPLFDKWLNDAGLGDLSEMRNDVNLNCPKA